MPTLWHGVTPNPKDHEIAAGFQKYAESGCDVIIAIGGGSCIDAGKGVAVLSGNGGSILDYAGVDQFANPIPPLLMIPSTAGTGADVSQFCVVTDTVPSIKATLIGRALVPDISITDPRLLCDHARVACCRNGPGCADARHRGIRLPGAQPADRRPRPERGATGHRQPVPVPVPSQRPRNPRAYGAGQSRGRPRLHKRDPRGNPCHEPSGGWLAGRSARRGERCAATACHPLQRGRRHPTGSSRWLWLLA